MSINLPFIHSKINRSDMSRRKFMKMLAASAVAAAGSLFIPRSMAFSSPVMDQSGADILIVKGKDYQDFPRFLGAKTANCLYCKQIAKTTSKKVAYAVVG